MPNSPEQHDDKADLDELLMNWDELEARDKALEHLDLTDATLANEGMEELMDDLDSTQSDTATIAVAVGGIGVANSASDDEPHPLTAIPAIARKPQPPRNSLVEPKERHPDPEVAATHRPSFGYDIAPSAIEETEETPGFLAPEPLATPATGKKASLWRQAGNLASKTWEQFRGLSPLKKVAYGVGTLAVVGIVLPAIISSSNDRQAEGLSLKSDSEETPATVIFENAGETATTPPSITVTRPTETTLPPAAIIPPIVLERGGEQREITEEEATAAIAANEAYVTQLRQDALDKFDQFTPAHDTAWDEMDRYLQENPDLDDFRRDADLAWKVIQA